LTPEDQSKYANRVKSGGCKKVSFTEGWVEFDDKNAAKSVSTSLNSRPIGGKKRHNFYHDDIWVMRYLPKFTWNDLTEHRVYQRQMNQKRLQVSIAKQKKEDEFFLSSVAKKKVIDAIEKKKESNESTKRKEQSGNPSLPRQMTPFQKRSKTDDGNSKPDMTHSVLDALAM